MQLRSKFLIIYLVTLAALAAGFAIFHRGVVLDSFLALEEDQARRNTDRMAAAVDQSLAKLSSTVMDWAPWEDTYRFLGGENPSYPEENLAGPTVDNLQINLLLFLNDSGQVFHSAYYEPAQQDFIPIPDNFMESILRYDNLTRPTAAEAPLKGVIVTTSGPMLVAAHPILKNDFSGPVRGVLIMGRILDSSILDLWSQMTGIKVAVQMVDVAGGTRSDSGLVELLKHQDVVVAAKGVEEVTASRLILDIQDRPALVLTAKGPRDIYRQGLATARESFWWVVGVGIFFTILGWVLLSKMVLSRWLVLEREVEEIGRSQDFSRRLRVETRDELGSLSENINRMLDQLREAHHKQRESENRFTQAFDHAALGMALADLQGCFTDVNPFLCLMLGYSKEELQVLQFNDITDPENPESGREAFREMLAGAREYAWFENRFRHRNGQVVWAMVSTALIRDDNGQPLHFVSHMQDISQSKTGELERLKNQKQLQTIADSLPVLIAYVDAGERYRFVNKQHEFWFERSLEEMLGHSVQEVLGEGGYESLRPILEAALSGQESFFEGVVATKEGPRVFSSRYIPHSNDDGTAAGYYVLAEDVTERKMGEQALKESEALFSGFMKHLPALAFMKDVQGRYVFSSEAYRHILDIDPEDRLGRTDDELYSEEVARTLRENDLLVLETGRSLERREMITDRSGREHILLTIKFPFKKADGSMIVAGVGLDVTEQVRAERELRESEAKYRTIMESTAHSITISDVATGEFYEVNAGFVELSGYTREEAIGRTVFSLNLMVDLREREEFIQTLKTEGEVIAKLVHYRNRGGDVLDTIFSAKPIVYGGKDCLVAVIQDVTALRKAEQAQAELLNQLQRAQKMEAVGTLAGGIAHDFNNILQTISGYLEILGLIESPHPKFHTYLSEINEVTKRAAHLVRQLLTFSRKVEPELKPTDLNEVVLNTVTILKHTLPKMITINTHLDQDLSLVKADHNQLEQVLVNLATNARDAMPEGGELLVETAEVVMDAERTRDYPMLGNGQYVLLKVSDTGSGMDDEVLKNIFTPFFTTKPLGQGTGLGLAMVYGIVREHGGQVFCDSLPGHGTVFSLYLPVFEGRDSTVAVESDIILGALGGHETIMLVDDEMGILEVTSEVLRSSGYQVTTARSGEEALEIFQASPETFDLVILDVGMPGMGGLRCMQELIRRRPDVAVLVASGYSSVAQPGELLEYGAAGYIAKPYRFAELLKTMRETLDLAPY
jgi:PAS domain S-box-containing protein